MADELWPIPKFNFKVELGDLGEVSFQEVSGLELETQFIEYRSGDAQSLITQKVPGLQKHGNITLKKGVFMDDTRLWEWWDAVKADPSSNRQTLNISLNDEEQNPLISWQVDNAFPVKITAPDLKSDANEIAVESIEIAHEGISLV